jgi:hypothetical protein
MLEYVKLRQKQLEEKRQRAADLEAQEEALRVAKMEAEAREKAEIAARKKLLREKQYAERLRQKHIQRKAKVREQKWNNQRNTLSTQLNDRKQKDDKLEEIKIIMNNRDPVLEELDWASWLLADPLNQRLAALDYDLAVEMFKRDKLLAKRRKGGGGKQKAQQFNYGLAFTGNDDADARADLVATEFTPNDPTNKGFSSSDRKPLAESGFTLSFWWRPDQNYQDSFPIGWKRDTHARFDFGIRNASKPWFGLGSSELKGTTWETMFTDSGNSDLKNTLLDSGVGTAPGSGNHLILNQWYHMVFTYAGTDNPDGSGLMLRKVYLNGYHIYGGFGEAKQSVNWTSHTGAQMARGLAFGMRIVVASGTDSESGLRNAKYNNGNACALSEIAIYDTAKDAAWVSNVYDGGTGYDHTGASNLVAYWKLDEGDGGSAKDSGPYGWDGILTNASYGTKIDAGIASLPPRGTPSWITLPEGYNQ